MIVSISLGHVSSAGEVLDRPGGWWGIWHGNLGGNPYKYSGGLGTYPWQHNSIAVHAPDANKTFFVIGLAARDVKGKESWVTYPDSRVGAQLRGNTLQIGVGSFDHSTGKVSRPHVLARKPDSYDHTDAHENATIQMDGEGYLYIFINSHGPDRYHSFIYRSTQPHDITGFEEIAGKNTLMDPADIPGAVDRADVTKGVNFSYSHPWYLPGANAFVFLHGRYQKWNSRTQALKIGTLQPDRSLVWTNRRTLLNVEQGHYLISAQHGEKVGMAFNLLPNPGGLDARTNLYFAMLDGTDETLRTVQGAVLTTPVTTRAGLVPALVQDFAAQNLLVYLKDIVFNTAGHPVIVFLTTTSAQAGAAGVVRTWRTARWNGSGWVLREIGTSDHNYDHGSLWIEPRPGGGEIWRLIAPLSNGPNPGGAGGTLQVRESIDQGATWQLQRSLENISPYNSNFARRVQYGHPDFAVIWADGDPFQVSASNIYFANADGSRTLRLPRRMDGDFAYAEPVVEGQLDPAPRFWEAEHIFPSATASAAHEIIQQTDGASNGAWVLLRSEQMGDWIEFSLGGITPGLIGWSGGPSGSSGAGSCRCGLTATLLAPHWMLTPTPPPAITTPGMWERCRWGWMGRLPCGLKSPERTRLPLVIM